MFCCFLLFIIILSFHIPYESNYTCIIHLNSEFLIHLYLSEKLINQEMLRKK